MREMAGIIVSYLYLIHEGFHSHIKIAMPKCSSSLLYLSIFRVLPLFKHLLLLHYVTIRVKCFSILSDVANVSTHPFPLGKQVFYRLGEC